MIIDFSALDTYQFCPAKWYEKYIHLRQQAWPKAQRNDALCLGSLVHEGLRVWQQRHVVALPDEVVEQCTPDRETYNLALELVYGYTRAYPEERWPLVMCEAPVTMPLLTGQGFGEQREASPEVLTLLAKIDSYFYVPELTQLDSGVPGQVVTLEPGWWIHEYKTKGADQPMGLYMQGWEMGMQASFQTLALQHYLQQEWINRTSSLTEFQSVQGVMVNVLEKPRRYVPKRKCTSCQDYHEYWSWLPCGDGNSACPVCGSRQRLKPLDQNIPTRPPAYYRFVVTRSPAKLAEHKHQIIQVGEQMMEMERGGLHSVPWHTKNCVDLKWKRACEYFGPHNNHVDTREIEGFVQVPDYRGLIETS